MNILKKTLFMLLIFATQATLAHNGGANRPTKDMAAQYKLTYLMLACYNGDVENVEKLLESPDTNVNATDTRGLTALMYAGFAPDKNNGKQIVSLLLAYGADIKAKTIKPLSVLDLALLNENQGIIDLLVRRAREIQEALDATHYDNEFRYNSFVF